MTYVHAAATLALGYVTFTHVMDEDWPGVVLFGLLTVSNFIGALRG